MSGIKSYKSGIEARNKQRVADRKAGPPVFPNIAQAQQEYDTAARSDGLKTMQELAEDQQQTRTAGPDAASTPRGLSDATVEGLKALKQQADAKAKEEKPVAAEGSTEAPEVDDELMDVLRAIQRDSINNDQEREAVKKRCVEIDFAAGLLSNEFTQEVPIIPGKLTVTYRTMNGFEHQQLRLYLFKQIDDDPTLERISGDLLGAYQTAAMVKKFNADPWESHLTTQGLVQTFNAEAFTRRVSKIFALPLPLLHALGVHGNWFDTRVRELFATVDLLKNG